MTEVLQWVKDMSSDSKRQIQWVLQSSKEGEITEVISDSDTALELLDRIFTNITTIQIPKYTKTVSDASKNDIVNVLKLFKKSSFINDIFAESVSGAHSMVKTTYTTYQDQSVSVIIDVITSPEWPEVSKDIIDSIMMCTVALRKIFPFATPPKTTKILLVPTPILKLYADGGKWEPVHINSGYTEHRIVVWRRQEILKVTIHELLHLYSIELSRQYFTSANKFKKIENKITPTENTMNEPRWNEGATEALATLLHIAVLCRIFKLDRNNFNLFLQFERAHARLIGASIYTVYPSQESKESTSVFSYFIVKSLLLDNLSLFSVLIEGDRSYDNFQIAVSKLISEWKPLLGIKKAPYLRMSLLGL